ncbi:sigma 54-interacting transcriptional regulator [Polyangium spumosum]|uniref:FHA domain-containing protein n=1 Tax=Polyangium spumosum TaxID=889282 RepID=A0A6N7PWS1_9BACT|nr:sigma 54-interacting transcriptional regulator [Polyangium spumosum]MRG96528.1 FHA domain-containing protein [Polyangium spumosum]
MNRPPFGSDPSLAPGVSGVGRNSETTPQFSDPVMIPRLELCVEREAGKATERVVVLEGELFRIGSHASNDLVITDPMVSRFHCRIARGPGGFRLLDTGSLNGSRIGGVRLRDADLPLPECRIELGESIVRVRELSATAADDVPAAPSFGSIFGASLGMRRMFELLKRVAKTDANVLIEGESGTGKELIATEIVRRSPRANKPLVIVDCGAISPNLIESELFGHVRGAFTGAERNRVGAFEAADGGTVFLDEIGELPLDMQPKLLRAIASRDIRRMGENQSRKVDVRVVAATNRRLEREVNLGRFREDLYYRLSVVTVRVPPLRERIEDVPLLVNCFLSALEATDKAHLFSPEVLSEMSRHDWPGNVRELRNYVERLVVLETEAPSFRDEEDGALGAADKPTSAAAAVDIEVPFKTAKDTMIDQFERAYLTMLLAWAEGNVSRAARKAQLDRMYLHRLLQRHGLRRAGALE